ncbi:aminoacyl-tRNA hydrolase [Longimonas halophila]|uniref:Peptidyl-tRNA hydrolase n=1 Tax=Longimonas halophila TaxID=1469170 RepID=A0A2H3NY73_9BACT|nr:aminoacyl-tRNA hydrolase [Longimonas halophila]PEN05515.1 aminoacyl-tRNA hydrolase [Longimonas halophila]
MASPDLLVVGLGNPGPSYANTRHNIGFQVVEALSGRLGAALRPLSGLDARAGHGPHKDQVIALAQPLTYMNRSGHAVAALLDHFETPVERLLVIVDDLHLDTGQLRLRPGGSSGGHNGLADIAEALDTRNFPRLRIGIGQDYAHGEQADYVLSPFSAQQQPVIEDARIRACNAVLRMATDSLDAAMNRYNG